MEKSNTEYTAAALYEGGWRAADKEMLMTEYELTETEVNKICELLTKYETE